MIKHFLAAISFLVFLNINAQTPTPEDCSVELWADVQVSPLQITLNWLANSTTTNYAVDRKPKNGTSWTPLAVTLSSATTQYIDNAVTTGTHYEYRVTRSAVTGTLNYPGYGYINSGIEVPVVEGRGKLILLIADTYSTSLSMELNRLVDDLEE